MSSHTSNRGKPRFGRYITDNSAALHLNHVSTAPESLCDYGVTGGTLSVT